MGEAKRRKLLDPDYGKESKLILEPVAHTMVEKSEKSVIDSLLEEGDWPNVQPVSLSSDGESILGFLLFRVMENDGTGVDAFTGKLHNEQFRIQSQMAILPSEAKQPRWLSQALSPKGGKLAPISKLASDLAKKLVKESAKNNRLVHEYEQGDSLPLPQTDTSLLVVISAR